MIYIYDKNLKEKDILPYSLSELKEKNLEIKDVYPNFLVTDYVSNEGVKYPKIVNGVLENKSNTELKIEGIINLSDGEYIENNEVVFVECTEDFYIKTWDKTKHIWYEGASNEQLKKHYISEMLEKNNIMKGIEEIGLQCGEEYNSLVLEIKKLKNKYIEISHSEAIEIDKNR